jgi:alcohol dehydrogenase, propanol-preferring
MEATMKAYRFVSWGQAPVLEDVPAPEPGPGQVLVRVGGAGVCRGDVDVTRHWRPDVLPWAWKLPFTLGHEVAGWVEEVGPGVDTVRAGEAVLVYGPCGCGRCRPCLSGLENRCEQMPGSFSAVGLGHDGGMAEYVLVPSAHHLVPLGDLDPSIAAPLADAALTPYQAIKSLLPQLVPGTSAVVIGVGGLGHLAIQLLRALSPATVVAVSRSDESLELAAAAGADHAVRAGTNTVEQVRARTGRSGGTVVLDCVGSEATLALAAAVAAGAGAIKVLGTGMGVLPFHTFALPLECSVSIGFWGGLGELAEVVALAQTGRLRTSVQRYPLSRVAEAYDDLVAGRIHGRAVVVPEGSDR